MAKIEAVHPADYRDEMWHGSSAVTMRQMVFGMNDGLVATVGLVAGLTFAGSSQRLLLGATLAAITAAVVSMALGSFLSTRTEVHYQKAQMRREQSEIEHRKIPGLGHFVIRCPYGHVQALFNHARRKRPVLKHLYAISAANGLFHLHDVLLLGAAAENHPSRVRSMLPPHDLANAAWSALPTDFPVRR